MAQNSLVHGLCTLEPVLPGEESPEQWDAHRQAIVTRLAPEGAVECALADQIALGYWRLARCARNEARAVAALRQKARWRAITLALTYEETKGDCAPGAFDKLEEALRNKCRLAELWELVLDDSRGGAAITAEDADLLLNDSVSQDAWAKLSRSFNETFSWPPKTVGDVREMLDWFGPRLYLQPDAWMRGKWVEARSAVTKAEERLAWIRQSVELEVDLAVLDPRLSATLQRYETTIQRGLHRDLHELQRIQALRLGITTAVPLAIDVSVE